MGFNRQAHTVTIFNSGDQPYEVTNLWQIGRAVASTLLHLQETENKYIYINSFIVTQNKVLAALRTKKKWVVRKVTVEHLAASGTEKISNGDVGTGTIEVITAAIYGHGGVNNFGEKQRSGRQSWDHPTSIWLLWFEGRWRKWERNHPSTRKADPPSLHTRLGSPA